jgi:hypothetical protein
MDAIKREALEKVRLPGRVIQKAVGKESPAQSTQMTVGFAHYSEETGPMEPHQHVEEAVHILDVRKGWVRCGPSRDHLGARVPLEVGMTLHFPENEWHVFEYDKEGYVDIIFYYGQGDMPGYFNRQRSGQK